MAPNNKELLEEIERNLKAFKINNHPVTRAAIETGLLLVQVCRNQEESIKQLSDRLVNLKTQVDPSTLKIGSRIR